MGKLLFTSYASHNRDQYLERFVQELGKEVAQLLAQMAPEDVVFIDRTGIKTGNDWVQQLSLAVSSCRVCVAICSPAFAASRYCGKEVRVFLDRLANWLLVPQNAQVAERPIFPIVWIAGPQPSVLAPFQHKDGDFPPAYDTEGLRTMYRLRKYANPRAELVTKLARRIVDALNKVNLPDGGAIPHFDHIPSAFHEQEVGVRYGVALLPLLPKGLQSQPHAGQPSLLASVQGACGERIPWHEVKQDKGIQQRLMDAENNAEVSVVVTDFETLANPLYQSLLGEVNKGLGSHSLVLVVRSGAQPLAAPLEADAMITVRGAFADALARGMHGGCHLVTSADDLRQKLEEGIVALRQQLVAAAPARKAEDDAIAQDAAAAGIPIDRLTALAGPGARLP
jgi:hypothetical protein